MTIVEYRELQARITEQQRFALWLAEKGEAQASQLVLKAVVRCQRIKPTKEEGAQS